MDFRCNEKRKSGMKGILCALSVLCLLSCSSVADRPGQRWTAEKASEWYAGHEWIAGCNFIPGYAVNQLEMWQEETFDPEAIDRELGWAEDLGFNCMRVFLHHVLWETDPEGFKERIDRYLDISDSHGISTMFVFLDDCWNESYAPGKQPEPQQGVHNSGWVKDPGILYFGPCGSGSEYAVDTTKIVSVLEDYVKDILETFRKDDRILAWDLYNEPGGGQDPDRYWERSFPLLKSIFGWAREVGPDQPLTAGIWNAALGKMNVWQIEHSDIITYHTYEGPGPHRHLIDTLRHYGRPMICTEYMARTQGSTFQSIMPILKREGVGAINWGLVAGKTNTIYAWATPLDHEPEVWFHDILRSDGTPYSREETDCIKSFTGKSLPVIPYPESVSWKDGTCDITGADIVCHGLSAEEKAVAETFAAGLKSSFPGKGKVSVHFYHERSLPDEAYRIDVMRDRIDIYAGSVSGTLYAANTLRQMAGMGIREPAGRNSRIPCVSIADSPRFGYRGMHLDCSRHFFSIAEVKKLLDLMSYYKLNRFHWHLTDDQGWRIEIKKYPLLTETGAWRNGTMIGHDMESNDGIRYGGYYTQEQLKEVVEYADSLCIEVIPEFDLPAHMVSALTAYPYLGCTGGPYNLLTVWDIAKDVLCAGKESSFEFIEDVLDEICSIFPSEYIHIGGDECPKIRWENCPYCQSRIKELGLEDTGEWSAEHYLQNYVTSRVQKILASKGRKIIGWDEILDGSLDAGATVMSWRGTAGGIKAAENGFDAIMTPCDYCYLDYCQSDRPELEPPGIGNYVPIEKCYAFEPLDGIPDEAKEHILGVQCNLWTEFIATDEHLEYMLLPRLLAISEVQWSSPGIKDFNRFKATLLTSHLPSLEHSGYNYCHVVEQE